MKQFLRIAFVLAVVFAAVPVYADAGGCVNSPELPTALLGVVGFAGAGFTYVRQRARARRSK
jgi:XrtJ-associated TM-motif-TM protein